MKHLLLAVLLLASGGAWNAPASTASTPIRLHVVTYNIHHGEGTDGRIDLERIAALLSSMQPDLVALQEVDRNTIRTGRVDQFEMLERLTGMRGAFGKAMDFDGGSYGVVDHSAKEGAGDSEAKTLHRMDKLLVIKEATGVGFRLAEEGKMLSRADDTRDFSVVKIRDRSDRFVLKFVKP